ncbi:MAG TPA: hypothetical protein DCQ28_04580 [Bacteroidetes bacterium]|nr:hypothetical protein [Bacteroidota bacterium]
MVTKEAIDAALSAHAQWKKRLQDAATNGQSDFEVEIVKKDNECQFGKWLSSLSQEEKNSEDYQKIKTVHAEFHTIAGEILKLAISGQKTDAMKMLEFGGQYGVSTGKLVLALNSWKSKL